MKKHEETVSSELGLANLIHAFVPYTLYYILCNSFIIFIVHFFCFSQFRNACTSCVATQVGMLFEGRKAAAVATIMS